LAFGQSVQIRGKGAERPLWCRVTVGRNSDNNLVTANIQTRGIGMNIGKLVKLLSWGTSARHWHSYTSHYKQEDVRQPAQARNTACSSGSNAANYMRRGRHCVSTRFQHGLSRSSACYGVCFLRTSIVAEDELVKTVSAVARVQRAGICGSSQPPVTSNIRPCSTAPYHFIARCPVPAEAQSLCILQLCQALCLSP
jgi:hypothetical protein